MPLLRSRPTLEGAIALGNLVLLGIAMILLAKMSPGKLGTATQGELIIAHIARVAIAVLAFPLGWIRMLFTGDGAQTIASVICVPLNAYLWGYAGAALVRLRRRCTSVDKSAAARCQSQDGRSVP